MTRSSLGETVLKVRSKNAGPFWITIDIFCGSEDAFRRVSQGLSTERIAAALSVDVDRIKRFEIPSLNVVKLSLARPSVQGSIHDRDMHGAALASPIQQLPLN